MDETISASSPVGNPDAHASEILRAAETSASAGVEEWTGDFKTSLSAAGLKDDAAGSFEEKLKQDLERWKNSSVFKETSDDQDQGLLEESSQDHPCLSAEADERPKAASQRHDPVCQKLEKWMEERDERIRLRQELCSVSPKEGLEADEAADELEDDAYETESQQLETLEQLEAQAAAQADEMHEHRQQLEALEQLETLEQLEIEKERAAIQAHEASLQEEVAAEADLAGARATTTARSAPVSIAKGQSEFDKAPPSSVAQTVLRPEPRVSTEGIGGTTADVNLSPAVHRHIDTGPLQWEEGAPTVVESEDGREQSLIFPTGFFWGTATSAYQIEGAAAEGGRSPSIWDTFSAQPGRVANGDTGAVACEHYHRYREDVKLMRELNFQAYRFSISWSRLLPQGRGEVNPEAVTFYGGLIDELLSNNIQPWVTIYHWDLPQCLEDEYSGWLDRQVIEDFTYYAKTCFSLFGDRVSNWITFNEPWCSAVLGYANGEMAPGRDHEPEREPYLVAHHIILAHARAVHCYRKEFQETQRGQIGITLNMDWKEALTESVSDKEAQGRTLDWQLGWFADPIWHGDYPRTMRRRLGSRLPTFTAQEKKFIRNTSDFFGLNHYQTKYVMARPARCKASPDEVVEEGGYFDDSDVKDKDDPRWLKTDMGWPVVPWGLKRLCELIQDQYAPQGGIIVTENGCAAHGEGEYIVASKPDTFRVDYFKGYLAQLHKSIQCGADVRGYFAWSFMDNFEWHHGYSKRFGIVHVNYKSQVRTPKASANFMAQVSLMNAVQISTSLLEASDFRPIDELANGRDRLEAIRSDLNTARNGILELKMERGVGAEDEAFIEEISLEADATTAALRDLKSSIFFASLGINGALYYDSDAFAEDNAYEHKFDSRGMSLEEIIVIGVDMCKSFHCGGFVIYDSTLYFRRHSPDLIERGRVIMPDCTLVVVRHDHQEDPYDLSTWTVVGANGRSGIWVRRTEDPSSALLGQLNVGAKIREIEAIGQRLHYEKIAGDGPDFGWVTTKVGQTDVVIRDADF